jgi:hypothetical protein
MGESRFLATVFCLAVMACGSATDSDCDCADGESCIEGVCVPDGDPPPNAAEVECNLPEQAPASLLDTCFAQVQAGTLAPNLRLYDPRFPVYGHGADTRRWIYLPPGSQIDAGDIDGWRYPVGTIVWQEMAAGDRIETRVLEKTESGVGRDAWRASSYLWLSDQSDAHLSTDGTGPDAEASYAIDGATGYPAPEPSECMSCHQSAVDTVLGFTTLQLSDDERQGNLEVWEDYLDTAQPPVQVVGNERDQAVLGYLHSNCGTCHSPRGTVGGLGLDLGYPVASVTDVESTPAFQTAVYQSLYITPGNAALSQIYTLFADQSMPPADASAALDSDFQGELGAWISELEARTAIEQATLPITITADATGQELLGYGVTANDGQEGQVFTHTGYANFRSRLLVPIDTSKTYRVTGRFRSAGAIDSRIYFGLSPYDSDKAFISAYMGNRTGSAGSIVLGTTTPTSLALAAAPTGWNQAPGEGYQRAIGFYFDGDTSHLPDYVLTNRNDGAYTTTGATLALNSAIPDDVFAALTADTVVHNHYSGGTYLYNAASSQFPTSAWTEYTGTITGEAFAGGSSTFRPDTVYVRFMILANYQQDESATLYFTDLTIAEE